MIQEPIQPTTAPDPPVRPARTTRDTRLRIGLVIGLCLLLAAPVVVAMAARGQGPDRSSVLSVGASPEPSESAEPGDENDQGKDKGPKADRGLGKGFRGDNGGPDRGPITIKAIDGDHVSLATVDGWTRTITVTSATVITKGGQTIAIGALKVGDEVRFSQVRNADGTYAITAIVVPTPEADGEVTAVSGSSITIRVDGGTSKVITVTGSTAYKLGSGAGAKADVRIGADIEAAGTVDGGTFTAITIVIEPPHIDGVVTAKTADTITVKRGDGTTSTIHLTAKTTYAIRSNHAARLADITVGSRVTAEGTLRADGSLDAAVVHGKPAGKGPKPGNAPEASEPPG